MKYWLTRADAPIVETFVKRFDPLHWTVDFPRGTVASLNGDSEAHSISVTAEFLRKGDLVGLIYESADRHAHPAHARETSRDFSGCVLRFHWAASGMMPLDAVNGPTLTVEGKDAAGTERAWYVRLWNYASGSATSADIILNFDALDGGFSLPADASRVDPRDISRMFISMVPPDYLSGSSQMRSMPAPASVTLSNLRCEGRSSSLSVKDAVAPEHWLRIATAYDDLYHLPPKRVVDAVERLGFRGTINHYIGMSHYFALDGAGLLDPSRGLNSAAAAWHRDLAEECATRGYDLIWSLSYEVLDQFCPASWKQRAFDGSAAATGYDPPSALISPANQPAVTYLANIARELVRIAKAAALRPMVQIGEPWWWVTAGGAICLYDDAAKAAFGGSPPELANVRGALSAAQKALLDAAGAKLAASTATIAAAVKDEAADALTLLLAYLPGPLDPSSPELRRANLPTGWAKPAFDVLQLEDYEWVTGGQDSRRRAAYAAATERLGYPPGEQHYLSGFVATEADRPQWQNNISAARQARERGCAEVFLWALPQVLRDGLTLFGGDEVVTPFEDVSFPIEIGAEASVSPSFSTNIVVSASGHEYRNANWQQARLRFDAGPGVRSEAELQSLIGFFRARRGPAVAFRFRDPFDHSSAADNGAPQSSDQLLGIGDGVRQAFELRKSYGDGEQRRITRPVAGSVRVAVGGVEMAGGWALEASGQIRFDEPPSAGASVTAGFQFDVPVRFEADRIEVNRATFLAGEAPSVSLIEVREG